ncbi:hypothetical protein K469DRAFT_751265 [Zopfia rhizophila CBS 207.26]|uniref:BTB domain-containing protein n=1 Tax=Zopfia rhizophila CBS 207.26 TaxID=1314779 RepID=A0A6A6DZY8_9PEZI|nr:hypothetical protein K469DRAFT_751265 [Zopfia rhizophila CBS 207.26]
MSAVETGDTGDWRVICVYFHAPLRQISSAARQLLTSLPTTVDCGNERSATRLANMASSPNLRGDVPVTTTIDKRGDVLLQLSKDDTTFSLLVSSRTLSLASPVFEAMFNHGFAEGRKLSSDSPRAIPLPDDDPSYMALLFMIVHMETSSIPVKLELEQLADFALLCDKLPKPQAPRFPKLLFVTYVLDLPHEFYKVTQSLVRDRAVYVNIGCAMNGHDFLPAALFDRLHQQQKLNQEKAATAFLVRISNELLVYPG